MIIGVLKELTPENRVSVTPEVAQALIKMKIEVWLEQGAGINAFYTDKLYQDVGAQVKSKNDIVQHADTVLFINNNVAESCSFKSGAVLIGVFQPLYHAAMIKQWSEASYTVISLDTIPRTTRAQSMDVLSSQANIAGYKAVLLGAYKYARYFPMFMTAAGSIPPAKVMIIGAGVAGLQAIATARRLGAVVEVFDTRPAVKEEVGSLGAKFIEVEGVADASKAGGYAVEQSEAFKAKQKAKIHEHIRKSDVVITTAQIPGKKAPILITTEMINDMRHGAVIIDLASATGGNTDLTKDRETILHQGVTIIGNSNLASEMPSDASKLYAKNVLNFLKLIIDIDGNLQLNFDDDIVKAACITHQSNITNERVANLL